MKIKWGALVVDGRGKIGGQVASKNGSGSYMRNKVTPSNPQSAAQTAARSLFGSISQQWSGLTAGTRNGWTEAVSSWTKTNIFGDSVKPTGKNLFQQLNNQAQSAGYPAVTVAPEKLEMVEGILTSVDYYIGLGEIELVGSYAGADARIVVYATASLSQGTTFVKNKLRVVDSFLANNANAGGLETAYVEKFGVPVAGANIYFGIKYVLPNGQASPMQVIKGSISA